ncbi:MULTISPECIES: K(+)-transporting ATPase subunit F [Legionella]|nr:MAG: K(+)-transporting ATPase subunit F [Legionella sp.]
MITYLICSAITLGLMIYLLFVLFKPEFF